MSAKPRDDEISLRCNYNLCLLVTKLSQEVWQQSFDFLVNVRKTNPDTISANFTEPCQFKLKGKQAQPSLTHFLTYSLTHLLTYYLLTYSLLKVSKPSDNIELIVGLIVGLLAAVIVLFLGLIFWYRHRPLNLKSLPYQVRWQYEQYQSNPRGWTAVGSGDARYYKKQLDSGEEWDFMSSLFHDFCEAPEDTEILVRLFFSFARCFFLTWKLQQLFS